MLGYRCKLSDQQSRQIIVPTSSVLPMSTLFSDLIFLCYLITAVSFTCFTSFEVNVNQAVFYSTSSITLFHALSGSIGSTGAPGSLGQGGTAGIPGSFGAAGFTGMPGPPGASGVSGTGGDQGSTGFLGGVGGTGATGQSGAGVPGKTLVVACSNYNMYQACIKLSRQHWTMTLEVRRRRRRMIRGS